MISVDQEVADFKAIQNIKHPIFDAQIKNMGKPLVITDYFNTFASF